MSPPPIRAAPLDAAHPGVAQLGPARLGPTGLLSVVTISGGVLMALEILSFRILSPVFGNSVYVWGSILSIFLAAMSAGYVFGGRLADRRPDPTVVGQLLLLAAAAQTLLLTGALETSTRLGDALGHHPWTPLIVTALLFGPATALLATVAPFAIRLTASDVTRLGGVAGRLYAVSTFGSLAGTLICTFVLIPFLPLAIILPILVTLTLVVAGIAYGSQRTRRPLAALATVFTLLWSWRGAIALDRPDAAIRSRRLSAYQTLEVRDSGTTRTLLSNGQTQTVIDRRTGEPVLHYPRMVIAAQLLIERFDRALILGLGGGSVGAYWQRNLPELEVDYVEIDPVVRDLAEQHFGFQTGSKTRVHLADGRGFLRRSQDRWDVIYIDTYYGLSIPFHLATLEMFELALQHLEPGEGVLVLNLAAADDHPFVRAIHATAAQVFPQTYVFSVAGAAGTLLIASQRPQRLPSHQLEERASALDARYAYQPTYLEVASQLREVDVVTADTTILRDAFAPVDRLLHLGG